MNFLHTQKQRTHIINPTVTGIMDTVGGHPDRIAGAIRSFMEQDYPFCKLTIFNRHPSPLIVNGIPDKWRMRLEIINDEDTYLRPVYQHMANFKSIRTDCWIVIDDDDTMEPGHISQLVTFWNNCTNRTNAPLSVCSKNYTAHYDDCSKVLSFNGWQVTLFETLTATEVDWCFKLFPQDTMLGSDLWIASNSYYDKREFEGLPTYHWDRKGHNHVSHHETNRGVTPREQFANVENYWRMKIAARDSVLRPVEL